MNTLDPLLLPNRCENPAEEEQLAPLDRTRERAEAIGREMVELTAHVSAAEAGFLELLAEFDRDELWRSLGCHSAAQWLTWQCGLGQVAARERVRIARALEKLPRISAAFRRGEISYSKVREMTRVALPETEEWLLNVALHGTAAQVQRIVAKYCRAEGIRAAAEAAEQHRRRYVRYRHDDDGTVVIEARLPVEIGEVVIRAIDAAVEVLYRDKAGGTSEEPAPPHVDSSNVAVVNECVVHEVETRRDVPAEAPAGDNAAERPAYDEHEADERVRESASNVPAGTDVAPEQFHSSSSSGRAGAQASTLALTFDSSLQPANAALTSHTGPLGVRRADALRLLAESFLSSPAGGRMDTCADRYQVVVHIDQKLLAGGRRPEPLHHDACEQRMSQPLLSCCELEDGRALAVETARRLACDASLVGIVEDGNGEPLSVGRRTRSISPALRRALRARDGGCRFPGCGRTRFTHGHHIVHWANGGETSLRNLITLCTAHHSFVHEGGFSVRRLDDGSFAFFAPDGRRLPESGRPEPRTLEALSRAAECGRVTLREMNLIDGGSGRPAWEGARERATH